MHDAKDRLTTYLRQSLPMTMIEMGAEKFASVLDDHADQAASGQWQEDDAIDDFVVHLRRSGAAIQVVTVSVFEQALARCGDPGPQPLCTSEFQGMPVDELLGMHVCRHPSARAVEMIGGTPATLADRYPHVAKAAAVLLTASANGVSVLPLTGGELEMFHQLAHPQELFSLLTGPRATPSSPSAFHRLVTIGAIIRTAPVFPVM